MKACDVVQSKLICVGTGVMGSTLKQEKRFDCFAMIIKIKEDYSHIMLSNGSMMFIKTSFLDLIISFGEEILNEATS